MIPQTRKRSQDPTSDNRTSQKQKKEKMTGDGNKPFRTQLISNESVRLSGDQTINALTAISSASKLTPNLDSRYLKAMITHKS